MGPRAYGSLGELQADPGVDVVHVTSHSHLHVAQAMALLGAGEHAVREKPLAMTAAESVEMVGRARASGRVAAVCHDTRAIR